MCEQTAAELTDTTTEFLRFLTIADTGAVAVDTAARYLGADGTTSVVSSCDIYEFDIGVVAAAINLVLGRARRHRTPDAHSDPPKNTDCSASDRAKCPSAVASPLLKARPKPDGLSPLLTDPIWAVTDLWGDGPWALGPTDRGHLQ